MYEHRVRPVVDLFVERARDDDAQVHFCGPDEVEDTLARALGGRHTAVPRRFPWPVPKEVSHRRLDKAGGTPLEAVATTATLGVSTTGTLVLTRGRRLLELGPELHVCVLKTDRVVIGVPETVAALNPHARRTWITGPAADHEIGLDLVDVALSSRPLHVVLVESDAGFSV
jgi:L-lactate dehydrogenase complex protein LldG